MHTEDHNPDIEVLLATYNGAEHLEEFLESLARQVGVSINLRVSDDSSIDKTLVVVEKFRNRFKSLVVTQGPERGPSENFFSLIKQANSEYIALADQDDIWEPTHLIESISRLTSLENVPAMTFSRSAEFENENNSPVRIWPKTVKLDRQMIFFAENLARGCTIVFNKLALTTINRHKPKYAIMHDWWIALLISLVGEIRYSESPEVNYRIHKNNFIGGQSNFGRRLRRSIISNGTDWLPAAQIREVYAVYGEEITTSKLEYLELFISGLTSHNLFKRLFAITTAPRLRSSIIEDFWLKALLASRSYSDKSFLKHLYRKVRSLRIKVKIMFGERIPMAISYFINIRVLKKHENEDLILESSTLKSSRKIALVVLYPRGPLLNSVKRLFQSLLDRNYEIIAVVNHSMHKDWISELSDFPISIIARANIGRDFGGYKSGISFINRKGLLPNLESLLMCNDSVFYGQNFQEFMKLFEESDAVWTTAFLNFEKHTHAQSFFQSFSGGIVRTPTFQEFWKKYYPSDSRTHAIDKGEVRLSQKLLSAGYFPKSIVNSFSLQSRCTDDQISFDDYYSLFLDNFYDFYDSPLELKNELFWHMLDRSFMQLNCSHIAGLLAFKVLSAPLKLDLLATGRVTVESIRKAILNDGIQELESEQLIQEFLSIRSRLI